MGGHAVEVLMVTQPIRGQLVEAVSEEAGHPAYRVDRGPDGAVETELPVRLLV